MAIQVIEATKDRQGNPLSVLNRQFISFSYGGKLIEDFGLIACFPGDRLEKTIYAEFNDTTTEQSELDGQLFWLSKYNNGSLTFTLATDGMTGQQMEEFKAWFIPGVERELILTEYHNRAILARVAAAPNMSMLPFEHDVNVVIGGQTYSTKTSLYKGEITIEFTMDDPFWYAKESLITSAAAALTKEQLKLIYEDGIPVLSMVSSTGTYLFANNQKVVNGSISSSPLTLSGADNEQNDAYLYYCGTAAAKPEISFNIELEMNSSTGEISFPLGDTAQYCRISLGVQPNRKDFLFWLPSDFSSYNAALEYVQDFTGTSILDLRALIRDNTYSRYSQAWAIALIDAARNDPDHTYVSVDGEILSGFRTWFASQMARYANAAADSCSVTINSDTGMVYFTFTCLSYTGGDLMDSDAQTTEETEITIPAGDMVKSDYLILQDRNLPNAQGTIGSSECVMLTTNSRLTNFKINYNYRYL